MADGPTAARLLTVHGRGGRVDLACPAAATVVEVAHAYAERAGLPGVPLLYRRDAQPLAATATLGDLGLHSGEVLVAADAIVRVSHPRGSARDPATRGAPRAQGGRRRRGRRRRHVVRTGDGPGPRGPVEGGRPRG